MKMYAFPGDNEASVVVFCENQPLCVVTLSHDVYEPYYAVWSEAFTAEESAEIEKLFADGQLLKAIRTIYAESKINEGSSETGIETMDELKKSLPKYIRPAIEDIYNLL